MTDWTGLVRATEHLDAPFAVVDLTALDHNADDLRRRAGGVPIRLASKSIRCRPILAEVGARDGYAGVMAYSLPEALWLAGHGMTDILVAYPSVDRTAWRALCSDPDLASAIAVVVDDVAHLDVIAQARVHTDVDVRLCLDIDASLRIGSAHLGVRRSPLRTPAQALAVAGEIGRRPGMQLVGLMYYDAQIAGLPDSSPAVRSVKRRSHEDLRRRRKSMVETLSAVADLEIVNGGGTGSLHSTGQDRVLTELAAGSGLYGPTLFDGYRDFTPEPAALFALPVVRRPAAAIATCFSGGYIASGPAGQSRVPTPVWPPGLKLIGAEGTGEVQTPVRGKAARSLHVGELVWFRHAKAGELCERVDELHLVRGDTVVETVPTYRGEGKNFG